MTSVLFWVFTQLTSAVVCRHFRTDCRSYVQRKSSPRRITAWPLWWGTVGSPETSINNYKQTLRKNPVKTVSDFLQKFLCVSLQRQTVLSIKWLAGNYVKDFGSWQVMEPFLRCHIHTDSGVHSLLRNNVVNKATRYWFSNYRFVPCKPTHISLAAESRSALGSTHMYPRFCPDVNNNNNNNNIY